MESTESKKIRCFSYSPKFIRERLNYQTQPIPGQVLIPHIMMTDSQKKKSVAIEVRKLFNSVTKDNITEVKNELRKMVTEYLVKTPKDHIPDEMNSIANEMLHNFIVSESNIKIYMQMLNAIFNVAVNHIDQNTGEPVQSKPIAYYFLNNCKNLVLKNISEETIRSLAVKNSDDEDELDSFNKEKAKICNLILTICSLYDQRTSSNIKLTAVPVHNVINIILSKHAELITRMKNLGNPYEDDVECLDEVEYECLGRMCSIYTELIIVFFDCEYESFMTDLTIISNKIIVDGLDIVRNETLADIVNRFKEEIFPKIAEPHMRVRCEKFHF